MSKPAITTVQDRSPHFWRVPNTKIQKDWLLSTAELSSALQNDEKRAMENSPNYADVSCDFMRWKWTYKFFLYLSVWKVTSLAWDDSFIPKDGWSYPQLSGAFIIWIFQCLACFSSWERKLSEKKFSVMIGFWEKPKSLFKRNGILPSRSLKHSVHCAKLLMDSYSSLSAWFQ